MIIFSNHSPGSPDREVRVITITDVKAALFVIIAEQYNGMAAEMAVRIQGHIRKIWHIRIYKYRLVAINHFPGRFKALVVIASFPEFHPHPKAFR